MATIPPNVRIIPSTNFMASKIALFEADDGRLWSYCASFRAARIAAMIPITRLRASSTQDRIRLRLFFDYAFMWNVKRASWRYALPRRNRQPLQLGIDCVLS